MFEMDRGKVLALVGSESSESNEFFQSEGSIIATKAAGASAYEKRIFPRPASVRSMFRSSDKATIDIHTLVDEMLAAENPAMKVGDVLRALGALSASSSLDALVFRPMTNVAGALYKDAEVYKDHSLQNTKAKMWSAQGKSCGIYYPVAGMAISNPIEALITLRLIGEEADLLFSPGSPYLVAMSDMILDMYGRVDTVLHHKTPEEMLTSPELQVLIGLNGIITGSRRLPVVKEMLLDGQLGVFFGMSGSNMMMAHPGPASSSAKLEATFGPEMAEYLGETMARIRVLFKYPTRRVDNAMFDGDSISTSDIPPNIRGDLWSAGTPSFMLSEVAASIRIFTAARKTLGKMRIRAGSRARVYQRAMDHLTTLGTLIESMPDVRNLHWAYDTDRFHVKTQFGGFSFTPEKYRVYYAIVNPIAEIAELISKQNGLSAQFLSGTTLMSYEPIAVTQRNASSDWLFDVPADHMALEIPQIWWTADHEEWMELKEWCRSQTPRVLRPSELDSPLGQADMDGIFPLNTAILEGTVMATALRTESMIRIDKARSLVQVDGNVCVPQSTLHERAKLGLHLYQLPDISCLAEQDVAALGDVPAGWDY